MAGKARIYSGVCPWRPLCMVIKKVEVLKDYLEPIKVARAFSVTNRANPRDSLKKLKNPECNSAEKLNFVYRLKLGSVENNISLINPLEILFQNKCIFSIEL
jgi:hypothetical protein